jgi:hypothetical protein
MEWLKFEVTVKVIVKVIVNKFKKHKIIKADPYV